MMATVLESEGFREFLLDLDLFYSTLDRHAYTNDVNLVEGLSSTTEEYRECLIIFRDVARDLPSNPVTDEAAQCLQELLLIIQDKCSFLTAILEHVQEDSFVGGPSIPNVSFTVSRVRRVQSRGGRPFLFVSRSQLEAFTELGFSYRTISKMLCVSERTLLRRRTEFGLPVGQHLLYSTLTDVEFDETVSEIMQVLLVVGSMFGSSRPHTPIMLIIL